MCGAAAAFQTAKLAPDTRRNALAATRNRAEDGYRRQILPKSTSGRAEKPRAVAKELRRAGRTPASGSKAVLRRSDGLRLLEGTVAANPPDTALLSRTDAIFADAEAVCCGTTVEHLYANVGDTTRVRALAEQCKRAEDVDMAAVGPIWQRLEGSEAAEKGLSPEVDDADERRRRHLQQLMCLSNL